MTSTPERSVTILHFDDEIDSIAPIPAAVFFAYSAYRPTWILESEVVFEDFIRSFVLRPPAVVPLTIKFELVDSEQSCRDKIAGLTSADIALFDLMKENEQGQIVLVGIELYKAAVDRSLLPSHLFVLTGFPHLLQKELSIPEGQKFVKPIAPSVVAGHIINLFPQNYRLDS